MAADEPQLRQALINLVRNAREAMGGDRTSGEAAAAPDKRLALSVRAVGAEVVVRVRDSGPGIGPADIGKIFDPFFSTKARGTGLGLALVQQIVVDHGGQIEVESAPGRGTTFTMAFPAVAASLPGGRAVGLGQAPVAEPVVERGEGEVEGGGVGGAEGEGSLEGGSAGGGLARRGEGAA